MLKDLNIICHNIKIWFIIFTLTHLILLQGCSCSNNKIHAIYTSEVKQSSEKVDINELLKNPDIYTNKIVEVIGVFQTGFEESAIYVDNTSVTEKEKKQALWITFNEDYYPLIDSKTGVNLLSSYQTIEKINKRKIKIRGKFNPTSKGHLGMFFGSIENVFYVEVMN